MLYNYIFNPKSKKKFSINSKKGINILINYLKIINKFSIGDIVKRNNQLYKIIQIYNDAGPKPYYRIKHILNNKDIQTISDRIEKII